MTFSAKGATSIDLVAYELALASRYREGFRFFAAETPDPLDGVAFTGIAMPGGPEILRQIRFARRLGEAVRAFEPDVLVVHQHAPSAALIARMLAPVPMILHRHAVEKPLRGLRRWWRGRDYKSARLIFSPSHLAAASTRALVGSCPPVEVLPNGIDASWQPQAEGRRRNEIVYAGRAAREKGVLLLADAAASVLPGCPDWRLRMILAAPEAEPGLMAELRARLAPLGQQAVIETDWPHAEVKQAFEFARLAVTPSLVAESFGRAALEAHAAGAALISSGFGALSEVSGDSACYFDPASPAAMALALREMMADPVRRQALAVAGLKRADAFRMPVVAAQFDSALARVAGRATAR